MNERFGEGGAWTLEGGGPGGPSHARACMGLGGWAALRVGEPPFPGAHKKSSRMPPNPRGGEDSHLLRERLDGYNRRFHASVAVPVDQTRMNEVETSFLARFASRSAETRGGHMLQMQTRRRD